MTSRFLPGIFYEGNASKKRWVLKANDPKTLNDIDAVFVTAEPDGGSQHPSGMPLLFAYLRVSPNHPLAPEFPKPSPKVVQRQLRHADARTTLEIYGHVVGEAHRDAVERVAAFLDGSGR